MEKMTTNTTRHISDKADSVSFDRENTIWGEREGYDNLQDILESITPIAIEEVYATDSNYGLVKIAKDIDLEELRGTDDVVTSKQMFEFNGKPRATYTDYGTTRYATDEEVMEGVVEHSVTAKQLQYKWDNDYSTRDSAGTIKLADESMVIPGTNDDTVMTPKLVKLAIDKLVPVPEVIIADEQLNGTVTLANVAITQQGTIRKGYAVSPYAFKNTNATTTIYGTVRSATVAEVRAGAIADKAVVTPKTFIDARATISQVGTTQLATQVEVDNGSVSDKVITPSTFRKYRDLINNNSGRITNIDGRVSSNKREIDDLKRRITNLENRPTTTTTWFKYSNGVPYGFKDNTTGFIIMWGEYSRTGDSQWVSFPTAFPNRCLNINITQRTTGVWGSAKNISVHSYSRTGFTSLNLSAEWRLSYLAVGY